MRLFALKFMKADWVLNKCNTYFLNWPLGKSKKSIAKIIFENFYFVVEGHDGKNLLAK